MTAEKKAEELIDQFLKPIIHLHQYPLCLEAAIECALIAVDIAIKCCKDYDEVHENYTTQIDHWTEVKREIEKL
jgi:hypothetical protein